MIGLRKNFLTQFAQRPTPQGKSSSQTVEHDPPLENTPPSKAPRDRGQILKQAVRERTKFFHQWSKNNTSPATAGAQPPEKTVQAKPAPTEKLRYEGPSVRITGTLSDAKVREFNRRLDVLNDRPTENGKPVSLNQRQASLEQRLDVLNGRSTENGKPVSSNQ